MILWKTPPENKKNMLNFKDNRVCPDSRKYFSRIISYLYSARNIAFVSGLKRKNTSVSGSFVPVRKVLGDR